MKTAMQELIEALEGNRDAFPDKPQFKGLRSGWNNAIQVAKSKLEKEKQQIMEAFTDGISTNISETTPEDYYATYFTDKN